MRASHVITTQATLPPELALLDKLARNLGWTWSPGATELFRQLDPELWQSTNHNPCELLRLASQQTLQRAAADTDYRDELARVASGLLERQIADRPRIVYFSAEFGLADCLPTYAGGLGVLAGDHLKAASDRGLDLAAVGLCYRQGYFSQVIGEDGWQIEAYPDFEPANLPLEPTLNRQGQPLTLELGFPGRKVVLRVWRALVGSVPLYLLDTDFEPNHPIDRELTSRLYGGDRDLRLRQEILLGIGGLRVVRALGLEPSVFHLNEGHAAFLAVERIRELIRTRQLSYSEAKLAASAGLIFTTHTPVPAGNDAFPPSMLEFYFGEYCQELGITWSEFLGQGRQNAHDEGEPFSMTVLALKLCGASNAVSKLHGVIARRMWHRIWPDQPPEEAPIESVTNGVHLPSWVAPEIAPWSGRATSMTQREDDVELWGQHEALRGRLVHFARARLARQLSRRGAGPAAVARAANVLDPHALTIGFARRFAGYKRATLLLNDPDRLSRLLNQPERPVQIVFAGKAHPHDDGGKELIREVLRTAAQPRFRHRLVFLEDYDLNVARHLVQGVDVWMNTPRRPLEASGTSGMKAVANGALHLSTLDGWWDEAFDPALGWAVGDRREYHDVEHQDHVDRESLFELLEQEIVPDFYDRDDQGLPCTWIAMMRRSLATLPNVFSTDRMVAEYDQNYYQSAMAVADRLAGPSKLRIRRLSAWLERVDSAWPWVRVEQLATTATKTVPGEQIQVEAMIRLQTLQASDVVVDAFFGRVGDGGDLLKPSRVCLESAGPVRDGRARYRSAPLSLEGNGRHGFVIRVAPRHPDILPMQARARAVWGP